MSQRGRTVSSFGQLFGPLLSEAGTWTPPAPPTPVVPHLAAALVAANWEIFVLDSGRNLIGMIDTYEQLDATLVYNANSPWLLQVQADSNESALLLFGSRIRVMRNEVEVLEGPIRKLKRQWNLRGDTLFTSGIDNLGMLADRIIVPDPAGPPYTSAEADVNAGAVTDVIKQYVRDHAGASAIAARQITGLTVAADNGVGGAITGRPRFKNLLNTLVDLALIGGDVQFKIANMEFDAFLPQDVSSTIIFSTELGNIEEFTKQDMSPQATFIYAGGTGEGTARTIVETNDGEAEVIHGRVEWFYDRRNVSDAAELQAAVIGHLREKAATIAIQLKPLRLPNMDFQTDWNLGSKVTVVLGAVTQVEHIRKILIKLSGSRGEEIQPVIASARAERIEPIARIYEAISDSRLRIEDQERSV